MPTLTKGTTLSGAVSQTVQNNSYTFATANNFVDRNIALTVNVPGINLANSSTFTLNDGITTWYWAVDASGNVTIT